MKKLLLSSAALIALGLIVAPAHAQFYHDHTYHGIDSDAEEAAEEAREAAEDAEDAAEEAAERVEELTPNDSQRSIEKAVDAAKANGKPTSDVVNDDVLDIEKPEKSIKPTYETRGNL